MKMFWIFIFVILFLPRISFGAPILATQQDLNFGQVTFSPNAQLLLDTNGSITISGGAGVSGVTSESILMLSGLSNGDIINSIKPPNNIGNVGGATVQINTFTCFISGYFAETPCSSVINIAITGGDTFVLIHIGATATLPNGSLSESDYGPYTDNFDVTVRVNKKKITSSAVVDFQYVRDIVITKNADLDFGKIALDPTQDSTVRLNPGGTIQAVSGSPVPISGHNPASFSVIGEPNYIVNITLPADGTVFMTGPGTPIPIDNFADDAPSSFNGSGTMDFNVGGDVTIGQNQTPGSYTGAFSVDVDYQ